MSIVFFLCETSALYPALLMQYLFSRLFTRAVVVGGEGEDGCIGIASEQVYL